MCVHKDAPVGLNVPQKLKIVTRKGYTLILLFSYNWFTFLLCFTLSSPVGWGCRRHRLLLCRGVIPPHNGYPGYDTKQSDSDVGGMGNAVHVFIAIAPRSILARSGSTWKSPIYRLNRTKLRTYAELNGLK